MNLARLVLLALLHGRNGGHGASAEFALFAVGALHVPPAVRPFLHELVGVAGLGALDELTHVDPILHRVAGSLANQGYLVVAERHGVGVPRGLRRSFGRRRRPSLRVECLTNFDEILVKIGFICKNPNPGALDPTKISANFPQHFRKSHSFLYKKSKASYSCRYKTRSTKFINFHSLVKGALAR